MAMQAESPALVRPRPKWLLRLGREVNGGDLAFRIVAALFAAAVVVTLGAIALQLARASSETLRRFGLGFVIGRAWDPVHEAFGALPFIYGTIASSMLALLIAVPIAVGVAIFLVELAPKWIRAPASVVVELLAAVPSVLYGLWGIFVLAPLLRDFVEPKLVSMLGFLPFFRGTPRGFGLLAGGMILAIMILPSIAAVTREVLTAVPGTLREGALALGATRWEMVRAVVLPTARSGILGAVVLGLGRALGETMAVTMVIGNRPEISLSVLDPSYTMASVLANELIEATSDVHLAALAEIGLLLFVVTVLLNVVARLLVAKVAKGAS